MPFMRDEFVMQYIYVYVCVYKIAFSVFAFVFAAARCGGHDSGRGEFIALLRDIAESSRTNLAPVRDKGSCEYRVCIKGAFFSASWVGANRVREAEEAFLYGSELNF